LRIFITGATGFIGSHLARALVAEGHQLGVLVRPASERMDRLPAEAVVHTGDLLEPDSLTAGCEGAHAVVHCGAAVGVTDREGLYQRTNVEGTLHLLRAASAAGVERVIILSSGSVLGPVAVERADATTPLDPRSAYARSKAECERRSWAFAAASGLPLAIVRPPWVYGPDDFRTLGLYRAIHRRWPMPWRTEVPVHPVHIRDLVDGILGCLRAFPAVNGGTYHLAGPRPRAMREVVPLLAAAMGRKPPPHVSARLVTRAAWWADGLGGRTGLELPLTSRRLAFFLYPNAFSNHEAKRDFDYAPTIELERGMGEVLPWYRDQALLGPR
jgi:nucleoside-diphosphate-sugar epimerase